ncbi:MAG: D-alanine--D-alanine ligase [Ignavibacteria bacterium]|nr:D-alanine--D-alanine ligase [Ignavibacteria bacterium]
MNIAVLLGGISAERNVSIAGGKAIANALTTRGHTVTLIDPSRGADAVVTASMLTELASEQVSDIILATSKRELINCVNLSIFDSIDVAFTVLHGTAGEDGIMQALLEARGVKYTGSKVLASALAMDKAASKVMFSAAGVQTPLWSVLRGEQLDDTEHLREILDEMRGIVVVKPNDQGSTVGMSIIDNDLDHFHSAVHLAAKFSNTVLVEQFIEGRELTVAVVGDEALPIIEIVPEGGFYDYEHKYTKGMTRYICPAELSEDIVDFVQNLALTAHKILGCTAYSRVDFRLDEDNVPFCLEVNTLPGFTETSLVPMAAAAAGIEFGELCERIIELS